MYFSIAYVVVVLGDWLRQAGVVWGICAPSSVSFLLSLTVLILPLVSCSGKTFGVRFWWWRRLQLYTTGSRKWLALSLSSRWASRHITFPLLDSLCNDALSALLFLLQVLPYWGNPQDRKTLRKFWAQVSYSYHVFDHLMSDCVEHAGQSSQLHSGDVCRHNSIARMHHSMCWSPVTNWYVCLVLFPVVLSLMTARSHCPLPLFW